MIIGGIKRLGLRQGVYTIAWGALAASTQWVCLGQGLNGKDDRGI